MVKQAESKGNIDGNREKYMNRYAFTGTIICGHCGRTFKRHLDNCGSVAESACWICNSYINEGKNSCSIGRIKEETIKGLFVRVFNHLYTNRATLLEDYKARLEREKLAESDDGQLTKLDAEIENLLRQERMLLTFKDMGYADLQSEHAELAGKLTKFQAERVELVAELTKQDERIARSLQLEAIIEAQGGPILEFSEDLFSRIVEKVLVKERTKLVFHLKNGLAFEETYTLKRGRDLL
ncbi:MAG: zinc ribbon domain-containing protein [Desulfitobacteriaceae bacterium]|nr:zinc ribbon domain-containing protein [Desulfitobacteriaceae bacterium]MDI6916101.1 zinc ribbon domain-containing protein [Desulfitobacteriaceae bacterium]